jgi:DNA-binding transcriptional LysR family regulator
MRILECVIPIGNNEELSAASFLAQDKSLTSTPLGLGLHSLHLVVGFAIIASFPFFSRIVARRLDMAIPEVRFMQAAIALAEELNYLRASERLHISQPALSKQIIELESQLGFRLFDRNHQTVEVTPAGMRFVEEARESLLHAERAAASARAAFSGADEVLSIGKTPYTDPFLVSILSSIRLPLFPGMRIKFTSNYSKELSHQVLGGTLDLALITGIPDTPKLSALELADRPYYIAMALEDELALQRELHFEDLHDREWIRFGRHANPHAFDAIDQVASDKHVRASDHYYIMTPEEAPELILEHRGLAFLPRQNAWRIARDGITMRPLAESRLRLVPKLAMRANSKSRLVNEFVKATSRKLSSLRQTIQPRLPLAG